MNIDTIIPMLGIIADIGDAPGRTPRFYASCAGNSPSPSRYAKLDYLERSGIIISEPATHCGRPVSHLSLTAKGQSIYALILALRAIPEEGSP